MRLFRFYCEEANDGITGGGDAGAGVVGGDIADGSVAPTEGDTAAPQDWMLTETLKGEGEIPEWLNTAKYKNVESQAKAYKDLESRFGSFTGAPEDYDMFISDELKEKGVEFNSEDPHIQEFTKWAKESNLSQDGFNGLLNLKGMMDLAESDASEKAQADHQAAEMKLMGPHAQDRIDNINSWATANLTTEQLEAFNGMASSSAAVGIIESLIGKTRNAPISPDGANAAPAITKDALVKMQFEKDDHGNRRLQTDPEFRARFQKLSLEIHGGAPSNSLHG